MRILKNKKINSTKKEVSQTYQPSKKSPILKKPTKGHNSWGYLDFKGGIGEKM